MTGGSWHASDRQALEPKLPRALSTPQRASCDGFDADEPAFWGLGREFVGADQGPWPSHGRSSVHEPTPFRASRSIRPDFNHFPSLIKSPVGNGSVQLYKIAEASERLNGNQHVIDERPSPDLFDRYEKFVSQRHQQ